jgi:hypothetical protein
MLPDPANLASDGLSGARHGAAVGAALAAVLLAGCVAVGGQIDPGQRPLPDRDDLVLHSYHAAIRHGISDPIPLEVDDQVGSFLVQVRGQRGLYSMASFVTPSGKDLIESKSYQTNNAREVAGLVDWLYPNAPDYRVSAGKYLMLIRAFNSMRQNIDDDVDIEVYTRDATPASARCAISLDFRVDQDALGSLDVASTINNLVIKVRTLYSQIGVQVLDHTVETVVLPEADVLLGDKNDREATTTALADARVGTVHILMARALKGSTMDMSGGGPIGYSLGLPGPVDINRANAAVLVGASAYIEGNQIDLEGLATTVTHEIGHYLGLYHTSELTGDAWDPIPDTPECHHDAICEDADNIMFPQGGASRTKLSEGQGTVVKRHPLCAPM